jgi:hypothetical protein
MSTKDDPSNSPSTIPKGDSIRLKANHHRPINWSEIPGCRIQAVVQGQSIRIYLPGEVPPVPLRPLCRRRRLQQYQNKDGSHRDQLTYSFSPFPGLVILIEPREANFSIIEKTDQGEVERAITRDSQRRLILTER